MQGTAALNVADDEIFVLDERYTYVNDLTISIISFLDIY